MENRKLHNQEPPEDHHSIDLRKIIDRLLVRWHIILLFLSLSLVVAFLTTRYTNPVYIVESTVLIKPPQEANSVSGILYGEEFFGRNNANLENEAVVVKSNAIVEKSLRDLNFQVSYILPGKVRDIELYDKSPVELSIRSTSNKTPFSKNIELIRGSDSTYTLRVIQADEDSFFNKYFSKKEKKPDVFSGKIFRFGTIVEIDKFVFRMKLLTPKYKGPILIRIDNYSRLTKQFRENLTISPYSLKSSVLKISLEGNTPPKLMDFVNKLVENYIKNELEQKNNIAAKTIEFINKQIAYMGDSLSMVEDRLEVFKSRTNTIDLDAQTTGIMATINNYNRDKSSLNAKMVQLQDMQRLINNNHLEQIIPPSSMGIEDQNLDRQVNTLIDLLLEVRVVESEKKFNNPLLGLKHKEINVLKENISEVLKRLVYTTSVEINNINSKIGELRSTVSSLPKAAREYTDISRNYQLNEQLYMFLMQKKAEAGIAKASNSVDFRIIDTAQVQGTKPVKPSPILNYAFAVILGLALPILMILVFDYFNKKINSKEELLDLTNISILGTIAKVKEKDSFIVAENRPKSAISESFRNVRSNLRYLTQGKSSSLVFLITSSISGEGKTFVSQNLAYVFSNFGKKVVIIHADMRKKANFEDYGIESDTIRKGQLGLSDYLAGIADLEDIIQESKYKNLLYVTPGAIPPNPSELLISGKFDEMLYKIKGLFDYVIIDTPPIGIISDAIELMSKSDLNIFVVRKGYTLKSHISEINNIHNSGQLKNLSLIFNDVDVKKSQYGYGYYEEDFKQSWIKKVLQ